MIHRKRKEWNMVQLLLEKLDCWRGSPNWVSAWVSSVQEWKQTCLELSLILVLWYQLCTWMWFVPSGGILWIPSADEHRGIFRKSLGNGVKWVRQDKVEPGTATSEWHVQPRMLARFGFNCAVSLFPNSVLRSFWVINLACCPLQTISSLGLSGLYYCNQYIDGFFKTT